MRFVLLATLVVFTFAQPAASDISAGTIGSFALVDSTGKIVGGLIEVFGGTNSGNRWVVSVDTTQGAGFLKLNDAMSGFKEGNGIRFSSADCTGPAWTQSSYGLPGLDSGLGLTVDSYQHLYAVTGPETNATIASRIDAGNCFSYSTTGSHFPVTYVGDLGAEYTPPFRIVSASSQQQAAVPVHIGWLLGGVLLGLGIKAAAKKR